MTKQLSFIPILLIALIESTGITIIIPLINPIFYDSTHGILDPTYSVSTRGFLYSLTISSYSFAMFFGTLFLSSLSDYYGRKKILIWCLLGTASGVFLSVFGVLIKSISLLIIGRILDGFTASTLSISRSIAIDFSHNNQNSTFMSQLVAVMILGFMTGPFLGAFLLHVFGLLIALSFIGVGALLNVVLLTLLFQESLKGQLKNKFSFQLQSILQAFKKLYHHHNVLVLAIINVFYASALCLSIFYLPIILNDRFSMVSLGVSIVFIVFVCSGILGALSFSYFFKDSLTIFRFSLSLLGAIVFLTAFILNHNLILFMIFATIANLFLGYSFVAINHLFSEQVSSEIQGWVMGVNTASNALSYGLASLIASVIILRGINEVYYFVILLGLISLLICCASYYFNWINKI